jgi:hypothetical protein
MSLLLISIILSVSPYWGQDTILKKDDLKVVMYQGIPPEKLRKPDRQEESPVLIAKVAADGNFKAQVQGGGSKFDGRITKIDGDKIELIIQNGQLLSSKMSDIKTTVKLNEPIKGRIQTIFFPVAIAYFFYFRVIKNTEEIEVKPVKVYHHPPVKRPALKIRSY